MPLSRINLTPDVPELKCCYGCSRRKLGCHTGCIDSATEHIVSIISATDANLRRQLEYDQAQIIKQRYKRGLYE